MTPTVDKDFARRNRSALEAALRDAGGTVRGRDVCCPFHEDADPSGSIHLADGVWRYTCHAAACGFQGDVFDVVARATGQPLADVLPRTQTASRKPPPKPPPNPDEKHLRVYPTVDSLQAGLAGWEATYTYTHPDTGRPDLVVLRIREGDDKRFLQARLQGDGFVMLAPPKPWPLYNRTRVRDADTVVVCEGEKCVHALTDVLPEGFAATTSPGGAKNPDKADWSPLAGKRVYLWPDRDPSGFAYVQTVEELLGRLTPPPALLRLDPDAIGLTEDGEDVVDFLDHYGGPTAATKLDAVDIALSHAKAVGPADGLRVLLDDTIAGRRACVPLPWPALDRLTQALLPGTVTLLCGAGGASKSFWLLEALYRLHRDGQPVALFALEDSKAYHLNRLLAQLEGNEKFTDAAWVKDHPAEVRTAFAKNRPALDGFAPRLFTADSRPPPLRDVAAWVEDRAAEGARVLGIDPVTAATVSERRYVDDLDFMMRVKAAADRYGCSLILTTHPAKSPLGRHAQTADALAGGAAYERFAHTVLWLHKPDTEAAVTVGTPSGGKASLYANRSLRLLKTRNGSGQGLVLAYRFYGDSLTFSELGVIQDE
jgi:hypothetical protein